VKLPGFLVVFLALGSLFSCDLLFDKPNGNLMKDIESSVWKASAPHLNVAVYYEPGSGTTTPAAGNINPQPKQKIPFNVSFAAHPDYGFVEWRAYKTGNRPRSEVEWQTAADGLAGIVDFKNSGETATVVTIKSLGGGGYT
jgi:hypothetical protein